MNSALGEIYAASKQNVFINSKSGRFYAAVAELEDTFRRSILDQVTSNKPAPVARMHVEFQHEAFETAVRKSDDFATYFMRTALNVRKAETEPSDVLRAGENPGQATTRNKPRLASKVASALRAGNLSLAVQLCARSNLSIAEFASEFSECVDRLYSLGRFETLLDAVVIEKLAVRYSVTDLLKGLASKQQFGSLLRYAYESKTTLGVETELGIALTMVRREDMPYVWNWNRRHLAMYLSNNAPADSGIGGFAAAEEQAAGGNGRVLGKANHQDATEDQRTKARQELPRVAGADLHRVANGGDAGSSGGGRAVKDLLKTNLPSTPSSETAAPPPAVSQERPHHEGAVVSKNACTETSVSVSAHLKKLRLESALDVLASSALPLHSVTRELEACIEGLYEQGDFQQILAAICEHNVPCRYSVNTMLRRLHDTGQHAAFLNYSYQTRTVAGLEDLIRQSLSRVTPGQMPAIWKWHSWRLPAVQPVTRGTNTQPTRVDTEVTSGQDFGSAVGLRAKSTAADGRADAGSTSSDLAGNAAEDTAPAAEVESAAGPAHYAELEDLRRRLAYTESELEATQARLAAVRDDVADDVKPLVRSLEKLLPSCVAEFGEQLSRAEMVLEQLRSVQRPPSPEWESELHLWGGTSLEFAGLRLPSVAELWAPSTGLDTWLHLHVCMLSCKILHLGEVAWAKAYAEALGSPAAELHVIPVEPDWLTFADAWTAGVNTVWSRAHRESARLHLLVFQEVDQACVRTWLRPFTNLHLGLTKTLGPDLVEGWPANLRLLWTTAGDVPSTIAERALLSSSAQVLPTANKPTNLASARVDGYVSYEQWRSWAHKPRQEFRQIVVPSCGQMLEAAACASEEVQRLAAALDVLGLSRVDAESLAQQLRLKLGSKS